MKDRFPKRFLAFGIVIGLMFGTLFVQLVDLQLRGTDEYGVEYGVRAESKKTKTITSRGDRGMIIDSESKQLAYDKKVYDIKFYRDPTWKPTVTNEEGKEVDVDAEGNKLSSYGYYTQAIIGATEIITRYGGTTISGFSLEQDPETGEWAFNWGDITEAQADAREKLWRTNFYVTDVDTQEIFQTLCDRYKIPAELSYEEKHGILSIWQEMQMNAFLSKPITIAQNVNWETVIEIEAKAMLLYGITVAVNTQRVYPNGTLACHVIGYIGRIQNYDRFYAEYQPKGYSLDDMIGLDGVEKSMEDWLTASSSLRQGRKVVEIDRYGRVNRTISNVEPQNGNNVKLTINSALQRVAEEALASNITDLRASQEKQMNNPKWLEANKEDLQDSARNWEKYPLSLAEKGALVVLDMEGRVLALASYPPYDPNVFIQGGTGLEEVMTDPRYPLLNYAIGSIDTPGSIFKMVTASAGMASVYPEGHVSEGQQILSPFEEISDGGYFDLYDRSNPPRCWIAKGQEIQHANLTVVQAIQKSCNYFFYTIGSRLGSELLYKYASLYGLTSKTGIDLPGELQGIVGNQQTMYNPEKPIKFPDQQTSLPFLVSESIKGHLMRIGKERNIDFDETKLEKTAKRLMDMAVSTDQDEQLWVRNIRTILLEELDMPLDMVYLQVVVGDIYIKLNDIKWGGNQTIMTAVGQSITLVSPIAVARYVAAVANGGTVYDVTLIDSIISPEGEVLQQREPIISSTLPDVAPYLPYIQMGMQGVVDDEGGTASGYFKDFDTKRIAAKTGSAEKTNIDLENNGWFVAFAPFENPEIAVVCYIPNGWGGSRCAPAVRKVLEYYLDSKTTAGEEMMSPVTTLAY